MSANVWINEVEYDEGSTDNGQFIELAGTGATSLAGWTLALYDGSDGRVYKSVDLTGTIPGTSDDMGVVAVTFAQSEIQDGSDGAEGIALVDNHGNVVQFLSYHGQVTAVDGPATGMTSTDILVDDPLHSIQLAGSGHFYQDFHWSYDSAATKGTINTGETLVGSQHATLAGDVTGDVQDYAQPVAKGTVQVIDPDSAADIDARTDVASDGGYGMFSITSAGKWSFHLDAGDETVHALTSNDTLHDTLSFYSADGTSLSIDITITGISDVDGTNRNDRQLLGGLDIDLIRGLNGNDVCHGRESGDYLVGGRGVDQLFGDAGADTFVFDDGDTGLRASSRDEIGDFSHKQLDVIDLSDIDGKIETTPDDKLKFYTSEQQARNHEASVWVDEESASARTIYINTDADKKFEAAIEVHTRNHLAAGDFLL
jgi:VCBS repeat-containing protein